MRTILFILCDDLLASSITLPIEMLRAAEGADRRRRGSRPEIDIRLVAEQRRPIRTRAGIPIYPDGTLEQAPAADFVYLPALWRNPRPILKRHRRIPVWLREQYERGTIISAVGTGCCFMAEAGLLDDKPATTHWHYFDQFQRDYPRVRLKRQYFITRSGNLYCAGSVNALADLTVHFIRRIYGSATATQVERNFSHEIRRPVESHIYLEDGTLRHADEEVTQAQLWLQDNYGREIRIAELANRFNMSVRTLNRRFRDATGQSPLQFLQDVRIEVAKDLLQSSNLSIGEIVDRIGYQDSSHFSALFRKILAVSPKAYRETVRAKLFSAR